MNISRQTLRKLIEPVINKDIKNWRIILDAMRHWLSDPQMEMLLEIIHNDGYKVHRIGDIVKFQPESWHFKDQIMHDIMKDWKLMDDKGYMYGRVVGDCSYGDDYDPFHYKLKLKVYLHGEDKDNWDDPNFKRKLRVVDHEVDNTKLFSTKLPMAWRDTIKNLG
jgi:hypothetical protein